MVSYCIVYDLYVQKERLIKNKNIKFNLHLDYFSYNTPTNIPQLRSKDRLCRTYSKCSIPYQIIMSNNR